MRDLDAVTVLVKAPSGRVLDVIEDVSLGCRAQAAEEGRESLYTATLWAYLATHEGGDDA